MTVVKSVRSRKFLAALSALAAVAATLLGANVASGDEVWNQSYQLASQSEECVAQPGETPWQDSWGTNPGWSPSWAKWANEGQGGWTCNRSITWAQTPVPASSSSGGGGSITYTCSNARVRSPGGGACVVGDIGPGGGLVFLISGGLTYEMAPKTWSGGSQDPLVVWCNDVSNTLSGTFGTAIGTGAQNTALMDAGCTSGAGQEAADYAAGVYSDWFLPSQDELNAMYGYKNSIVDTATYGFASNYYWSSSQKSESRAWYQYLFNGDQANAGKGSTLLVRPVRAF